MDHLREARKRHGLTQGGLAAKLGVTQPTIANWEHGITRPNEKQEALLVKILSEETGPKAEEKSSLLAEWLRRALRQKDWSVGDLAINASVTPPAIYRILSGNTRNLQTRTRERLEKALESPIPTRTVQAIERESTIPGLQFKLTDFDPHDPNDWPREAGVYVFYDVAQHPVYVGQGLRISQRIRYHSDRFWFKRPIVESASWVRIENKDLRLQIEQLLIKFLKSNAVLNLQGVDRRR